MKKLRILRLFEEYIESADYKIDVFFRELQSQIQKWFTDGSLAAQGCELDGDVQITNINPMEKFLIFNFTEPAMESEQEEIEFYRYRVTFMVRLDQMSGDGESAQPPAQGEAPPPASGKALEINKVLLKIHQFDDNNKEKGELVEEVSVEDIKEDFIIDKLGQLKEKSEDTEVDQNDLKDNIHTA